MKEGRKEENRGIFEAPVDARQHLLKRLSRYHSINVIPKIVEVDVGTYWHARCTNYGLRVESWDRSM